MTCLSTRNPSTRLGMEKLENLAGALGADPRNLAEVRDGGPLDLLQRSEVMQQGTFARRPDAADLGAILSAAVAEGARRFLQGFEEGKQEAEGKTAKTPPRRPASPRPGRDPAG